MVTTYTNTDALRDLDTCAGTANGWRNDEYTRLAAYIAKVPALEMKVHIYESGEAHAIDALEAENTALTAKVERLTPALVSVIEERQRQDAKWGGPEHDDAEPPMAWVDYVTRYASWAGMMALMGGAEGKAKYRRRMMQTAALAVAAVEAYDRAALDSEGE